jgi:hypothetical protein
MHRIKCIECNKTLRNYNNGQPRVHRACWLSIRQPTERNYDFLFCKDKEKQKMKKTEIYKPIDVSEGLPPINEENDDIASFDLQNDILSYASISDLEIENELMKSITDIAGNLVFTSSSSDSSDPPSPSSETL